MDEGTKCDELSCGVVDLLPFHCPQCDGCFCLAHRSRFSHSCMASQVSNPNTTNTTTSTFDYKKKIESVTSRFDNEVPGLGDSKSHFSIKSSQGPVVSASEERVAKKVEKLSSLESTSKRSSTVARKTKEILISKNAKGNASIAGKDRFFFVAQCPATDTELHLFFSVTSTLGEVLNQIANAHPLSAFGTMGRPSDKTLRLFTPDTPDWRDWDVTVRLPQALTSFETVSIVSVDTSEAVQAQTDLVNRANQPATTTVTSADADVSVIKDEESTKQHSFEVGSLAVYKTSSGALETVRIIGVHHDDFPNVYYTIRQPSGNERQTDSNRLTPRTSATSSASVASASSILETFDPQSFPVLVSYQGKVYTVSGVLPDDPVTKLHALVAQQLSVHLPSPILLDKVSLKLIYKGKILHANENLKMHKLTRNCTLTLIISNLK